jgi:hypothetical protein
LFGIVLVAGGLVPGAPRFMDESAICHAFGGTMLPAEGLMVHLRFWLDLAPSCRAWHFDVLWWLNEIQKFLLALLTPALVLGTISCLAEPETPTNEGCQIQARALSTHLYLTASVLVIGLLYLSALLRWPGSGFGEDAAAPYNAHVDAYILYWGITYSIFIASYYVPVAIRLTRGCESSDNPMSELLGLLKSTAAIFAPALAGLLGGVVDI